MQSDLTPIVVPGKRGQKRQRRAQLSPLYTSITGKPTRRPIGGVHQSSFSRASAHVVTRLSAIERLPTELTQMLFSHGHMINLARASPFIARQLSVESIYLDCAVNTLYCWDSLVIPRLPQNESLRCQCSDHHARTIQLLSTRWMTTAMLKRAMQRAHELYTTRLKRVMPGKEVTNVTVADLELLQEANEVGDLAHVGIKNGIPVKLLQGPWTNDKAMFLWYLCWKGYWVDWSTSICGETAVDGLRLAITEGCRRAVAVLVSEQIDVRPEQDMLRAAVVTHGCDRTIVYHLLNAAARRHKQDGAVDFHDPVLWRWATGRERAGDVDGTWLTQALKAAASLSSTRSRQFCSSTGPFARACGQTAHGVEEIPLRKWNRNDFVA